MPKDILKIVEATKTYHVSQGVFRDKKPLHAVNGVNLTVSKGSVLGLVGESGCGKTTLAKLILGLEKTTSGEIYIGDQAVSSLGSKDIAKRVQPIFQDPYSSLNPRKSVFDIISLPLRALHIRGSHNDVNAKVDEIMDMVGLSANLKYNYPNQLSGGQRQRVAVARAFIMRPDVVLCDEPTSALDVSVQAQILNMLMRLRRDLNMTYVLISHNLAVVQHMATHVAVMYLGRIVEYAETDTLFKQPCHPYTHALLKSVMTPEPRLGVPETHLGIVYPNPIDPPSGCTFHPRCTRSKKRCTDTEPEAFSKNGHLVECHYPACSQFADTN
jgi:peptide/nickel transport system ATP-binding protein